MGAKQWVLAVNNAVGGLLVALVIKHADSLLRGFASAIATIISAVAAVFCFGFQLAPSFAAGTLLVIGATLLYGNVIKVPGDWWNSELKMLSAATVAPEKAAPDYLPVATTVGKGHVTVQPADNPSRI